MALTVNGIRLQIDASELPSGFLKPTVATFDDFQYTRTFQLSVVKSSVENATPATTVMGLVSSLQTQLTTELADFDNTETVLAYGDLVGVKINIDQRDKQNTNFWDNTAITYSCTVIAYVKIN